MNRLRGTRLLSEPLSCSAAALRKSSFHARGGISLTPWLQPGDQEMGNKRNRFQRFSICGTTRNRCKRFWGIYQGTLITGLKRSLLLGLDHLWVQYSAFHFTKRVRTNSIEPDRTLGPRPMLLAWECESTIPHTV
jgi:hypothetical protein